MTVTTTTTRISPLVLRHTTCIGGAFGPVTVSVDTIDHDELNRRLESAHAIGQLLPIMAASAANPANRATQ